MAFKWCMFTRYVFVLNEFKKYKTFLFTVCSTLEAFGDDVLHKSYVLNYTSILNKLTT